MKHVILSVLLFCFMGSMAVPTRSSVSARQSAIISDGEDVSIPYVTEGLIAMWDGEWNAGLGEHDNTTTTWKDLIGDNDLSYLYTLIAERRYWLNNGFYQWESGSLYWRAIPSTLLVSILKDGLPFTVEVVAMVNAIPSSANSSLINIADGAQSTGMCISYNGTSFMSGCKDSWGGQTGIAIAKSTWDYIGLPFYGGIVMNGAGKNGLIFFKTLNGEVSASSSAIVQNQLTINLTKMVIGAYAWSAISSRNHRGVMYCIRIYNRALSDDELDFNYLVDKERFGQ